MLCVSARAVGWNMYSAEEQFGHYRPSCFFIHLVYFILNIADGLYDRTDFKMPQKRKNRPKGGKIKRKNNPPFDQPSNGGSLLFTVGLYHHLCTSLSADLQSFLDLSPTSPGFWFKYLQTCLFALSANALLTYCAFPFLLCGGCWLDPTAFRIGWPSCALDSFLSVTIR